MMASISSGNVINPQEAVKKPFLLWKLIGYSLLELFFILILIGITFVVLIYFNIIHLHKLRFSHKIEPSTAQNSATLATTVDKNTIDKNAIIAFVEDTLQQEYIPQSIESGPIKSLGAIVRYEIASSSHDISSIIGEVVVNKTNTVVQKYSLYLPQTTLVPVSSDSARLLTQKYIKNPENDISWACGKIFPPYNACLHNEITASGSVFYGIYGNTQTLVYVSCFIPKTQLQTVKNVCP